MITNHIYNSTRSIFFFFSVFFYLYLVSELSLSFNLVTLFENLVKVSHGLFLVYYLFQFHFCGFLKAEKVFCIPILRAFIKHLHDRFKEYYSYWVRDSYTTSKAKIQKHKSNIRKHVGCVFENLLLFFFKALTTGNPFSESIRTFPIKPRTAIRTGSIDVFICHSFEISTSTSCILIDF